MRGGVEVCHHFRAVPPIYGLLWWASRKKNPPPSSTSTVQLLGRKQVDPQRTGGLPIIHAVYSVAIARSNVLRTARATPIASGTSESSAPRPT